MNFGLERLVLEKAHPRYLRPGRPISVGVFGSFCAFFALLRVVPELSASRSWGALDDEEFFVMEARGWR